jgi:hypothetical protein
VFVDAVHGMVAIVLEHPLLAPLSYSDNISARLILSPPGRS